MKLKQPARFSLLLLLVAAVFLVTAMGFSPRAKVVPLVVSIPTVALLVLQVVSEMVPGLADRLAGLGQSMAVKQQTEAILANHEAASSGQTRHDGMREVAAFGSVLFLLVLILVTGLLAGSMLFVLWMFRRVADADWKVSVVYALSVSGLCYGLFILVLGTRMWNGVFALIP